MTSFLGRVSMSQRVSPLIDRGPSSGPMWVSVRLSCG
jgi:hypothetical protein